MGAFDLHGGCLWEVAQTSVCFASVLKLTD
jgi:hypothetical protein